MNLLDDLQALSTLDPGGMLRQVADLPHQLGRAPALQPVVSAAVQSALHGSKGRRVRQALLCGMGGSAIGGDYAARWAAAQGVSLQVHRGTALPGWVDENTLLLFSSYSGNTEETLSAYASAPRTAPKLCITTGGALQNRASADAVPCVPLPAGLQPRAALGHSLVAVLLTLDAVGWFQQSPLPELSLAEKALETLARELAPERPWAQNRAKQLASACATHLTWIWTANGILEPVGRRWRAQWNENAKTLALASAAPEMCHNEIMAVPNPAVVSAMTRVVVLEDVDDPTTVHRRLGLLEELLSPHVLGCEHVPSQDGAPLVRMLGTTMLGDFTSVYLAFLHGVDPTPVERIETLKNRLRDPA